MDGISKLLTDVTTTTVGPAFSTVGFDENLTVIGSVDGTGSLSGTVMLEVSHDGAHWKALSTLTLNGETTASDIFSSMMVWPLYRANLTELTGTAATVNVSISS